MRAAARELHPQCFGARQRQKPRGAALHRCRGSDEICLDISFLALGSCWNCKFSPEVFVFTSGLLSPGGVDEGRGVRCWLDP